MISTGVQPSVGFTFQGRPFFRAARNLLLLLFGIIYAGGLELFLSFSPLLLYGTYVVIIVCLGICVIFDWSITRNLRSVAPYLVWLLAYFVWGMLAAAAYPIVTAEGLKTFFKNYLLIGSLAIVLDRRTLKPFSQMVQIISIASLALCFWELANPKLIELIAKTRHEGATAYDLLRPAALWSNPDEAASSFIFALLLARWAGRSLAWLGCTAAVIGVYLGASRTGAYLLAGCGLVYAALWLKTVRFNSARLAAIVGSLLILGIAVAVAVNQLGFDPAAYWQFARILDFTEAKASAAGGSRLDIAKKAVEMILAGPWCGYGLFSFQLYSWPDVPEILDTPAHNIYLTVWGETGALVAVVYLLVLGMGVSRVFRVRLVSADRITILLMWFCYLVIGLTWHNQFTSFPGMIFIGLLYHLPSILKVPSDVSREGEKGADDTHQVASSREEPILLPGLVTCR